jgi:hypothetical protein
LRCPSPVQKPLYIHQDLFVERTDVLEVKVDALAEINSLRREGVTNLTQKLMFMLEEIESLCREAGSLNQ